MATMLLAILAVTAYAGIRPMTGVLELGRGGMQIYSPTETADYTGTYWGTAMTAYWDTAMTDLWDTAMNTEVPE